VRRSLPSRTTSVPSHACAPSTRRSKGYARELREHTRVRTYACIRQRLTQKNLNFFFLPGRICREFSQGKSYIDETTSLCNGLLVKGNVKGTLPGTRSTNRKLRAIVDRVNERCVQSDFFLDCRVTLEPLDVCYSSMLNPNRR